MANENEMQGGNKGVLLTAEVQPRQVQLGRHGEGRRCGQTDPLHDELEPSRLSRFGSAIKGIGRVTVAALVFAGAVSFASCSEESKHEHEDTDTVTETEMGTDTDTEVDTDTGTGPFNACEEFQNDSIEDNQATVQEGDSLIVGPTGYWMQVVIADANNQLAEVYFMDEMYGPVDSNGNPIENQEDAYAISTMDNPTLTVGFGGEEQEITICGVIETVDGKKLAQFVTNRETGFMECDYVNSGSDSNPVQHQVSTWTVQTTTVSTHYQGFTQGEAECPAEAKAFFVSETSTFEVPLPEGMNVPDAYFPTVEMRGVDIDLIEVSTSALTLGPKFAPAKLYQGDKAALGDFKVGWTLQDGNVVPTYEYPDVDKFQVENLDANDLRVTMATDSGTLVERVRYSIMHTDTGGQFMWVQLYNEADLKNAGVEPVPVSGTNYDVALDVENNSIPGMIVTEHKD